MTWAGAGKGAASGALAGAALGPWGAAAGGVIGGVIGGLSGGGGGGAQITENGYGGLEGMAGRKFAAEEAQREAAYGVARRNALDTAGTQAQAYGYNAGNTALQRGQNLGSSAQQAAFGGQQDAALNQARSQQLQNVGMLGAGQQGTFANQDRGAQQAALGRLQGFYQQGPGPSAAEAQMRQGQDAAMAQSIALAHSGRGAGANANAMRSAAFQNAAGNQQMNQQLGVLRANEAANWRQQQLGAMGLEQGTIGNMRGQDIGQQGQYQQFALGAGQQGLGYGQLGQGYQQIGNNAQLGFEGMGNQANLGFYNGGNQASLGFQGLANQSYQYGDTMRNRIYGQQAGYQNEAQIANQNSSNGQVANQQRQTAADQAFAGTVINAGVNAYQRGAFGGGGGTANGTEADPWGRG